MEDQHMLQYETKMDWTVVIKKRKEGETHETGEPERVAFYDKYAEMYNEEMDAFNYTGARETAKNLHKHLNDRVDARILDIGGGTGAVIEELKKFADYNNADGLDPASKMLEVAKRNGLYKDIFPRFFYTDSGIERESYDAIASCGAVVPGHIKAEAIKEMCEIVRPGGVVVITMRKSYLDYDEDLVLLRPLIAKMVEERKIEMVEDYEFDNYFAGHSGQVFALKKTV